MTLLRKKILGEDFHVTIKPIYNREDTLAFTFSPDQKRVEIGEEICEKKCESNQQKTFQCFLCKATVLY